MSGRPLLVTDCDEVLLHMVSHFGEWLAEAHGMSFDLTAPGFRDALRGPDGAPVAADDVCRNRCPENQRGFRNTEMLYA